VNRQVGVYCDCLAGFQSNKARIERQIPRVQRPVGRKIEKGQPVIVWASLEDPSSPDIIHQTIRRSEEFIEQQVCWSIIVFIFAYWDEEIRSQIARIRGIAVNDIKVDALGDLRILRTSIVHNSGVLSAASYSKLRVMGGLCKPDKKITFGHDQMHKVFVLIKQAIGAIILHYIGHLPGAPDASEIVNIAIQNRR
jgi:hypothetical protein